MFMYNSFNCFWCLKDFQVKWENICLSSLPFLHQVQRPLPSLLKLRNKKLHHTCLALFLLFPVKSCAVTKLISSLSLTSAMLIFSFTLLLQLFLLPKMPSYPLFTYSNLASPPVRSCWMQPSLWSIYMALLLSLWFNANSVAPHIVHLPVLVY